MQTKTLHKILTLVSVFVLGASVAQAQEFDTTPPSDVTNVIVKETTVDSIKLTWDAATDDTSINNYKVYYGLTSVNIDGGYYDKEVLTGSVKPEYTLAKLQADSTYYVAVTALDQNDNESFNYSIEISAKTAKAEVLHSAPTEETKPEAEVKTETETKPAGSVKAMITVDNASGSAPLKVKFDATTSTQKDGAIASYAWDYNSDGVVDATLPAPSYTFTESGVYEVNLVITATDGQTATAQTTITVWDTEVIEQTPAITETVEPVLEAGTEVVTTEPVEKDNLPETGPALLIPVLIAGAGALMTRFKK